MNGLDRRSLITGLISLVAAPAIVRVANLMPVKVMDRAPTEAELEDLVQRMLADLKTHRTLWGADFMAVKAYVDPEGLHQFAIIDGQEFYL